VKSASHDLSQNEIASDNPCSQHLSGNTEFPITGVAYQDFLTLWNDADPDIPILKEAKAEYAKLQ
jgi:hypothetical protein